MVNPQEERDDGQDAPTSAIPDDVPALQARLEEERQRAESHYASWQRAAADFANFKRRTEQERSEAAKFATSMLILHLLPVVDDMERALGNLPRELAGLTWIDGIELIYRKLQAVLEAQGLAPIEAVGHPFDPNQHEAVLRAPGPEEQVLSELQKGYALHGRVIRPSLVTVGTGGEASPGGQTEGSQPESS